MSLNKLTRGIHNSPMLFPRCGFLLRFVSVMRARLRRCRWCTVTQSRKERRRTVKRKRRYRRVFRRYRIPYHAYYQIVDESNNGLRSGWPRKLILNERATYSNPNFFHRYSSNLQYRSISIELATKIKKKCGKKRDSSMFYNNANNRIVISIGPMNDRIRTIKIFTKGYLCDISARHSRFDLRGLLSSATINRGITVH